MQDNPLFNAISSGGISYAIGVMSLDTIIDIIREVIDDENASASRVERDLQAAINQCNSVGKPLTYDYISAIRGNFC